MQVTLEEIKKIKMENGDILILPDVFSAEYRGLIQRELAIVYPDKKVGLLFVPDPNNVRIMKANAINHK